MLKVLTLIVTVLILILIYIECCRIMSPTMIAPDGADQLLFLAFALSNIDTHFCNYSISDRVALLVPNVLLEWK